MYGGILLAILAPLVWIYRRDTCELPWYLRMGLPLLRTLVLIGLLIVYLQPRWRSEREEHYRQPRADAGRYEPEHGPPRPRHARRTCRPDAIAAGGLRPG